MEGVGQCHDIAVFSPVKGPGICCTGGGVGLEGCMDGCGKSRRQQVSKTELSGT